MKLVDKILSTLVLAAVFLSTGCGSNKKLVVNSAPSNADVYLKGANSDYFPNNKFKVGKTPLIIENYKFTNDEGEVTEVEINDIMEEQFFVIIEKESYEPNSFMAPPLAHEVKLKVIPELKISGQHLKKEASFNGEVRITSNPTGAKIYIDNMLVGNSPYTGDLKSGEYELVIKQDGFKDLKEKVQVNPNKLKGLHFDLSPTIKNGLVKN